MSYFYPRPPRGGRHRLPPKISIVYAFLSTPSARRATRCTGTRTSGGTSFLSTPSARRATPGLRRPSLPISDFYPRPPRGGRLVVDHAVKGRTDISIHALREEGDRGHGVGEGGRADFYPRPPRGGRPKKPAGSSLGRPISIHALREEGDHGSWRPYSGKEYFYPRPPRGGRLWMISISSVRTNFYPRPPRGGRHRQQHPGGY